MNAWVKHTSLLWIGWAGLILVGCSRRGVAARKTTPSLLSDAKSIVLKLSKRSAFTPFRAKYQALYEGEKRQSFQLRLIVPAETVVWLSAGLMGFEGLRGLWRGDSLFLLNRLTQEAYFGRADSLRDFLPAVGPRELVALLTGGWSAGLSRLPWEWNPAARQLHTTWRRYHLALALILQEAPCPRAWTLTEPSGLSYHIAYEWASCADPLPKKVILTLPDNSRLTLIPKQISFGATAADLPPFQVPAGYTLKPLAAFRW
ncbi:MAG: DUF4292 domain-containing protein [Bacteroidia bacterium]|nr:DUF4292 domain-containing protein [Bacteroidia bacterium]GIV23979.1 MAG: hypothetical protein KatS3mg025_1638 [Bacteroidia bacterium]